MPEVEPITREEKLWSGEDIEPITREEQYIKHIYDKTQTIPSKPITRKEMLLEKAGQGGGSDVTIKQLSVTENGTYSEENTAYSPVIVNVPAPPIPDNAYLLNEVESLPKDIVTFDDGSFLPMPSLKVGIEPQQDLHGYDHPWAGGAGKNKLPMTVDGIKSVNTYHSWSGNSTTINNVTITIETDSVGNVTGIRFNGTASADITFNLATNISIPNGEYKLSNDQIVNVSNLWLSLTNPNLAITLSTQKEKNVTISNGSIISAYIYASSGNVFNNVVFKPMIRLATVSDSTFAPYSNICPISGWDECKVTRTGKNLFSYNNGFYDVYYTSNTPTGDGSFVTLQNAGGWKSAKIKVKGLSKITISGFMSQGGVNGAWLGSDNFNDVISTFQSAYNNGTKQVPDGAEYIVIGVYNINTNYLTYSNAQIEKGDTATTYEPYNGQTYNVEFKDGSNPLTVYGGTLDVVSGLLTINTLGINVMSQEKRGWQIGSKSVCYRITLPQTATSCASNKTHGAISNMMAEQLAYYGASRPNDLDSINFAIDTSGVALAVYDTDLTLSEQQMISKYTDLFVVYPLATPITYQLTPTQVKSLLGTNNVWADTGDIEELEYFSKEA